MSDDRIGDATNTTGAAKTWSSTLGLLTEGMLRFAPESVSIQGRRFPLASALRYALENKLLMITPELLPYLLTTWQDAPAEGKPSGPPKPRPAPPSTDLRVWPDEAGLQSISATLRGDPARPVQLRSETLSIGSVPAVKVSPVETDRFDDGTHFILDLGVYRLGAGLHFDKTAGASHLRRSGRVVVTCDDGRKGVISATELNGGGLFADGEHVLRQWERSDGMYFPLKFKTRQNGGPARGNVVTIDLQFPPGPDLAPATMGKIFLAPFA